MRFDTVLQRHEGAAVAAEVAALRSPGRILARGVMQVPGGRPRQFQMVVDEPEQAWVLDTQGSSVSEQYRDGTIHTVDGGQEVEFERSGAGATPIRMATPELLLQWGQSGHSYAPMLIQRVGRHSILLTFEHELDPALRRTLVVDERDGIARRSYGGWWSMAITDVRVMARDEPIPGRPRFRKLEAPLSVDY